MFPKQYLKPLLVTVCSTLLCVPLTLYGGEKSSADKATDNIKVPPVKTKTQTKPQAKAKPKHQSHYPKRGMSMQQVRKSYGEPQSVRKSKGKVKKKWPRITVWNYGAYSVYFERKTVLHTVVH